MFVGRSLEEERRKEVWNKLKVNVKEIEKLRNVFLLGCYGIGKLLFINMVIVVLMGRYMFYVDVGCGNEFCSIRLYK